MLNLTLETYRQIVTEYSSDRWFLGISEIVVIALYSLVIMAGIITNSIFCTVIWKTKRHLKTRNVLFINIAVSDIIMSIFSLPFTLLKMTRKSWILGSFLCKLVPSVQVMDVIVFSLTAVVISIDRYHVIVRASQTTRTAAFSAAAVSITWVLAAGISVPVATYSKVSHIQIIDNESEYTLCMEMWPSDDSRSIYTISVLIIQYGMPLVIITFLHAFIARFLRVRLTHLNACTVSETRHRRQLESYRRNVHLLTAVVVTFGFAWLPLSLLDILADFHPNIIDHVVFYGVKFNTLYVACHLVAMTTVFVNPIIYGWFNSNFRRDVTSFILRETNSSERKKLSDDFRQP